MPEVQRVSECLNCGAPLAGPYCAHCGQRGRYDRLRLDQIFQDIREDLVCGDLSFMRTIKGMLVAPGRTCREYIQGKRKSLVNPLKFCFWTLALLIGFTYLLELEVDLGISDTVIESVGSESSKVEELQRNSDMMRGIISNHVDVLLFFFYPLFALLLRLLFHRKGFNFTRFSLRYCWSTVNLTSTRSSSFRWLCCPNRLCSASSWA